MQLWVIWTLCILGFLILITLLLIIWCMLVTSKRTELDEEYFNDKKLE